MTNDEVKRTAYRLGIGLASVLVCLAWITAFLVVLSILPGVLTLDRAVVNWPTLATLLGCLLVLVGIMMPPDRLYAILRRSARK